MIEEKLSPKRTEMKKRRELVAELVSQRYNDRTIAEALSRAGFYNTSLPVIWRDIRAVKEEMAKKMRQDDRLLALIGEILLETEAISDEAWRRYRQTQDEKMKARYLRIISEALDNKVRRLQSIGYMLQVPIEIERRDQVLIEYRRVLEIASAEAERIKEKIKEARNELG